MRHDRKSRSGSILLLVLLAIVIMSLATASYLALMKNEHRATRNAGQQLQARMLVESGADYLCLFLDQTDLLIAQQGGLLANAGTFQGQLVVDDLNLASRGRFTVIAPDIVERYYSGFRYGLEDESSKLDLNSLATGEVDERMALERMMFLPGMTEDVADAILDWIDSDNQPRSNGAEEAYYQGLNPPLVPSNAPLRSLAELLQVRGVTPELLYGLDANRNYLVDESEIARGVLTQIDNTLGQINRGWSAYLTTYAAERSLTATGTPKININNPDLRTLQSELQQVVDGETANFILAYRQFGPAAENATGVSSSAASLTINLETPPTAEISSLLDLVGARVLVQQNTRGQSPGQQDGEQGGSTGGAQTPNGQPSSGGSGQPGGSSGIVIQSPWQDSAALYSGVFLDLLDKLTTSDGPARVGRININMAARPVLLTVPGLTELQADRILTMREPVVDRQTSPQRHAVWLLANGVVTLEEMRSLDPFVTAGGDVYTAQIVGFFDGQTATSRACVMFDRTDITTLVVGWEDLAKMGPGFSPEELGAAVIAD